MRIAVVIPTYLRPEWIRRAVHSLVVQVPPPHEVVAVARSTDLATLASIADLQAAGLPFELRLGTVEDPGFMPPVKEGFRLASADIIAVMDDDAEAEPGWIAGIRRHYGIAEVGAVGGRCINVAGDREVEMPFASRVGYVTWHGSFVGNMYKRVTFQEPVDVSFLMGGCMSFRAEVARRLEFDSALNRNVAFGYEIDLGLQVRNLGWRVVFDPSVAIRHYSAPRPQVGTRDPGSTEAAYWAAYNDSRVALRRLSPLRASIGWAYRMLVGYRRAPGLIPWVFGPLARVLGFELGVARSSLAGRLVAAREVLRDGRPRPRP